METLLTWSPFKLCILLSSPYRRMLLGKSLALKVYIDYLPTSVRFSLTVEDIYQD